METKLKKLKARLQEINDLNGTTALLSWDQSTYMPPGGASARGRQMATLQRLAQEKFIDPAIGKLLDALQPYEERLPYDSDDASLIRVARHDYEQQLKVPPALTAEMTAHSAEAYQVWTQARPENDFAMMVPYLEKTLDLSRQLADCFPGYEHIADPLIDLADRGMKVSNIQPLFNNLRAELVSLVKAITDSPPIDDSCLYQDFPGEKQLDFARDVVKAFGYDFERGRLDRTHHPFATKFSLGDVRLTTRADDHHLGDGVFATMHEAGHGIYEQGIAMSFEGSPLAAGTSSGVHESQSRLWENMVGRSRDFWQAYYPRLQAVFPDQLKTVPIDTFYRAINKVHPSLIRVKADEVTYNLHVMIRFDLEMALLEGSLAIKDLPDVWNARYRSDLGITPADYADGVLQDVHWTFGIGGVFQGYTLGNILGAHYFETVLSQHPEITAEMRQGNFATLYAWLKENIYRHGRKYTAAELTARVTGSALTLEPYIRYLKAKFGGIYNL